MSLRGSKARASMSDRQSAWWVSSRARARARAAAGGAGGMLQDETGSGRVWGTRFEWMGPGDETDVEVIYIIFIIYNI